MVTSNNTENMQPSKQINKFGEFIVTTIIIIWIIIIQRSEGH